MNGVRRFLRRTLESAKSLKSRACVRTVTRPYHAHLTKSIRLFHGARGGGGLELRTRAQTRHVIQRAVSGVKEYRLRRRDGATWREIGDWGRKDAGYQWVSPSGA